LLEPSNSRAPQSGSTTAGRTKRASNNSEGNFDRLFGTVRGSRPSSGLLLIDRDRIETAAQPRQEFDAEQLEALAASIRERREAGEGVEGTGILQPLLVAALPDERFRLIAGERRLRASGIVGLPQVPAVVVPLRADQVLVTQLIENLQRAALSPLEEAKSVALLTSEQGLSIRGIAQALGKDRGWVQNRARLQKVGEDVRAMVSKRHDSLPHAFEIEAIADPDLRGALITLTLEGAGVAEIRRRIADTNTSKTDQTPQDDKPPKAEVEPRVSFQNDTRGDNPQQVEGPTKRGSHTNLIPDALVPATHLAAEAARLLQNLSLTPEYRSQVSRQLDELQKQVEIMRAIIE